MDASEIYSRLNAKEVIFTKQGEFIFQPQMDESTFLEEIRNTENTHLDTGHPIRGESQRDFVGESEGSLPPPP